LLPSIFASLVLAAYGLQELASLLPQRTAFLTIGITALLALQIVELYQFSSGPTRQPYADIARTLSNSSNKEDPVYTTWSYGIGSPVNFYLGRDRVQPLPGPSALPEKFIVLYRPAVAAEVDNVQSLFKDRPGSSLKDCRYFSTQNSSFGTRLCVVDRAQEMAKSTNASN
jgi:hypothetical protein